MRDYLVNFAGEFIYSTALPPLNVAAASAALAPGARPSRPGNRTGTPLSRDFRAALRAEGWAAPDGDSPIVPVRLDAEAAALALAAPCAPRHLGGGGPPAHRAGRDEPAAIFAQRGFAPADRDRVVCALARWRAAR